MAKEMETFPQGSETAETIKQNTFSLIGEIVAEGVKREINPMQVMRAAKFAHITAESMIEWDSDEDREAFNVAALQHFQDLVGLALLPTTDDPTQMM
jgi:hypothetical protein